MATNHRRISPFLLAVAASAPLRILALLIVLTAPAVSFPAAALDAEPGVLDLFDPEAAAKPQAGQWLEYRVAFPVDPMENALSGKPLAPLIKEEPVRIQIAPQNDQKKGKGNDPEYYIVQPDFDPPVSWRVLPLRLEIRQIGIEGIQILLTLAGASHTVTIDHASDSALDRYIAKFYYDPPQPEDVTLSYRLGDSDYEITVVRRHHDLHGFVRWYSPLVPFGVVRYATADVDLALVAMGEGKAPDFLPDEVIAERLQPPPGLLYVEK